MALISREIEVTLTLAKGSLDDKGSNVVNLAGYKCDLFIASAGSPLLKSTAQLRIYGVSRALMNKFSTAGRNALAVRNDEISIRAGDSLNGMWQVFQGTINYAIINMASSPDVCLEINAVPGLFYQMLPAAANTYPGTSSVGDIVQALAVKMGFAFENHGVTTQLSNHYMHGTLMNQLDDVVRAAGVVCSLDHGIVKIWPNSSSQGSPVVQISPSTGLIGYPTLNPYGVTVEAEFNHSLQLGGKVNLTTSVDQASGEWVANRISHELTTQTHQGYWKSTVMLTSVGFTLGK